MSTEVEIVPEKSRSALTEKLLKHARKPLNDIAEITGIPVVDLAERYYKLFESHGWLTERQEERLLLIELSDMIALSREELLNVGDSKEFASVMRTIFQGMNMVATRMDTRRKLVEDDINEITSAQARVFASAFDIALSHIVDGLMIFHPEITHEEVDELAREGLKQATMRLDANVTL